MKRLAGLTVSLLILVTVVWLLNKEDVNKAQSVSEAARRDRQATDASQTEDKRAQADVDGISKGRPSEDLENDFGSTSSSYKSEEQAAAATGATGSQVSPAGGGSRSESWQKAPPLTQSEIASVQKFMNLAFRYASPTEKPSALLNELEALSLAPVATQDFNEDTGKMVIIRTHETLEGTRYFHAQFFEDEQKRTFLQHLSFEIRPSPDAMDQAIKMIEEKLGAKVVPLQAPTSHYALYKAPGDYIVWVKRLEYEDLKDDPFNARDPNTDIGTLRVAIEKDIHAHEND